MERVFFISMTNIKSMLLPQCDECLLSVHPECKEECKLCKRVAEEVELRWIKKRNFQEESINLTS